MPWWSWILLWVALAALSLLFFVALGFRLWRKATATMRGYAEVSEQLSDHWDKSLKISQESLVPEPRSVVPGSAVFATPEEMKDDYLAAKEERRYGRLQRRVARRKERGQLQSLRDIETLQNVG